MIKYFTRSLRYLRPYWALAVLSLAIMLLSIVTGLLEPWPLKILFDNVLADRPLPAALQERLHVGGLSRSGLLILVVCAGLLLTLLTNAFSVLDTYINTKIRMWISLDFRGEVFNHVQRLSMSYHDQSRAGMVIYLINYQADAAATLLLAVPPLLHSFFMIIGMFWIIFSMDRLLAMLALLVVPALYYFVHYYVSNIQARMLEVKMLEAESLSIVHETVGMIKVVMAFGREMFQFKRFRQQGEIATHARIQLTLRESLFSLAVNMTTATGTTLVLGFGCWHAMQRLITPGDLLVVMYYLGAVYKPLETISTTIGSLQDQIVSLRISYDLLDTEPDVRDEPGAVPVERAGGRLAFENVNFSYTGRENTLSNVSFEVEAGQVVALVGPTGAGKTTLISLIPRFYQPNEGRILLDGRDIRQITLQSLRDQISVVLQEPLLFSGTIAENIRYGRLDATQEEIEEAARSANAHDFIMRLPEGYETVIGERGAQLSGGERQRISVARAFLRDAPILILDEPTSSIDSKTEAVILDALDRLMQGRTTFMVAHRLSTIRNADSILVISGGQIIERGTHDELLKIEGAYAQLYEMQTQRTRHKLLPHLEASPAPAHANGSDGNAGADPSGSHESGPVATLVAPEPESLSELRTVGISDLSLPSMQILTPRKKKIAVMGMMSKHPVAGVIWQTLHYLVGFERLGYEAYYVEAGAYNPSSMLVNSEDEDRSLAAADFLSRTMNRFDMGDRWAFHALHDDGQCYGMSRTQLYDLYKTADLIINLHGATVPLPEHYETGRLVYLETDPVVVQVELSEGMRETIDYLKPHVAFFTFGENYGRERCGLPVSKEFNFLPTRQPVVMDFWKSPGEIRHPFTTVGNWQQYGREISLAGELYEWSKHLEFYKYLDLPARTGQEFELSLSHCDDPDRQLLLDRGWNVRDALSFSCDLNEYRDYISYSRGEFTVAKDQNIRLRTGWFSDRSATYLAAGRPVLTQDTGFGDVLPTGKGLFNYTTLEDAEEAVKRVVSDYQEQSLAAYAIAHDYFNSDVVLRKMLETLGV